MSDKSEFPDMDTGYVDSMNADRDIIAAECQRLRAEVERLRSVLGLGHTGLVNRLAAVEQERDQWREVAKALYHDLKLWRDDKSISPSLAAYERLKGEKP